MTGSQPAHIPILLKFQRIEASSDDDDECTFKGSPEYLVISLTPTASRDHVHTSSWITQPISLTTRLLTRPLEAAAKVETLIGLRVDTAPIFALMYQEFFRTDGEVLDVEDHFGIHPFGYPHGLRCCLDTRSLWQRK